MKRERGFVKDFLRPFIREHICVSIFCVLFFAFYGNITGFIPTLLFLIFILLYGTSIAICNFGMTKLRGYERTYTLTRKRLYGLSFVIGAPVYFLWFAFSIIPIAHYAVWLLTGLPVCIVTAFTLSEIADRWNQRRPLYWGIQVVIYLVLLFIGQWSIHQLFFQM